MKDSVELQRRCPVCGGEIVFSGSVYTTWEDLEGIKLVCRGCGNSFGGDVIHHQVDQERARMALARWFNAGSPKSNLSLYGADGGAPMPVPCPNCGGLGILHCTGRATYFDSEVERAIAEAECKAEDLGIDSYDIMTGTQRKVVENSPRCWKVTCNSCGMETVSVYLFGKPRENSHIIDILAFAWNASDKVTERFTV